MDLRYHHKTVTRRRQFQSKPVTSGHENIVRPSWKDIWRDYITEAFRNTTFQGLVYFTYTRRHPLEHFVWFLCVSVAVGCAVAVSLSTWKRYQDNPTVISLENNYRDWNISVAAVYICPTETIDEEALETVLKGLTNSTQPSDVERLRKFLITLAKLNHDNLDTVEEFAGYTEIHPSNYTKLVDEVSFKFEYYPEEEKKEEEEETPENEEEGSDDENTDANHEVLLPILTEYGRCYAYNSQLAASQLTKKRVPLIVESHLESGNSKSISHINSAFTVYFKNPWEVPGIGALNQKLFNPFMYRSNANMRVITTYATDDVRNLRVDHRKCRFRDESNLAISDIYSVNLCQSQCRAEMAIRLCGCAPFFYVGVERAHYNICDVQGMICLVDHVKKSKSDGDHKTRDKHSCACYPTCESEEYVIEDTTTEVSEHDTGGTKLSWCVPNYPTVRMKRDILFTLPDMLVAFGGTAAFFLGCSVLSAVEIFYYCTLRLFFYLLEVRRQRTRYIQHDSRTRVPTF